MVLRRFCKIVIAVVALFLCSCSSKRTVSTDLFPAGPPMADSIKFEYAVYMLPNSHKDPTLLLRQALATQFPELKLVDEIPQHPTDNVAHARAETNVVQEYAPPKVDSMKYFGRGVSPEQAVAVQGSKQVLILDFGHPRQKVWVGLRDADVLVETIARAADGLIWDNETRELFSPDEWHKERLAQWTSDPPRIADETTIHVYPDGGYARAITLGMVKVGLPDVVVERSPWASQNQVVNLINAFCQSMVEGATLATPGRYNLRLQAVRKYKVNDLSPNATGAACLSLKNGRRDEGDPKNRLIEISFDNYAGPDAEAKEDAMITSLFGASDSSTAIEHTQELLDASRKARSKLPELRKSFNAGLEPGGSIELKAPFATPGGGREWMWVEVTSWKDNHIQGTLQNDPAEVPNLHAGQVVEVREEDVFDYIRYFPDRHSEGNTTGDVLRHSDDVIRQGGMQTRQLAPVPNPCESH